MKTIIKTTKEMIRNVEAVEKIIIEISNNMYHVIKISKKSVVTYSHTSHILEILENNGIIKSDMHKRRKMISLTKKGKRIREAYIELNRAFSS